MWNIFVILGDFPTALKHYSESIKRNPNEARVYSNRAGTYTKLVEFGLALKDVESCLILDPTFVKAYLRKGQILLLMKETNRAKDAFESALDIDPNCQVSFTVSRKSPLEENHSFSSFSLRTHEN